MQIKDDDKGVTQTIVIPFALSEKLIKAARESGRSISSVVCEAIEKKLEAEKECKTQGK